MGPDIAVTTSEPACRRYADGQYEVFSSFQPLLHLIEYERPGVEVAVALLFGRKAGVRKPELRVVGVFGREFDRHDRFGPFGAAGTGDPSQLYELVGD